MQTKECSCVNILIFSAVKLCACMSEGYVTAGMRLLALK